MRPHLAATMSGITAWQHSNVPVRLTAITRSYDARSMSRNLSKGAMPALLTRIVAAPSRSRTSATAASMPGRSVTSTARPSGSSAGRLDLLDGGVGRLPVAIEHGHRRPLGGQSLADRQADPRGASGDDGCAWFRPGRYGTHVSTCSFAASIKARTAGGVTGSLVMSTPKGERASATALTTAGGAPMAPPSPTPL